MHKDRYTYSKFKVGSHKAFFFFHSPTTNLIQHQSHKRKISLASLHYILAKPTKLDIAYPNHPYFPQTQNLNDRPITKLVTHT